VDEEVAADILEEMEDEDRVRMLEALGAERAAELLAKMSPDDAADLIQDLDRADGEALLARLPADDALEIRGLLGYEEESAGGLMTTEYVSAFATELAGDVIERLRRRQPDEEHAHHVFVTDEDQGLVGQLSLYELVVADPRTPIGDLMHGDPVAVTTDDEEDQIVEAVMKYNLLAVPVVDASERLVGVITVDDVIDLVGPHRGSHGLLG
jgi:magnesium transporter